MLWRYNIYTAYSMGPCAIMRMELNLHLYVHKFIYLQVHIVQESCQQNRPHGNELEGMWKEGHLL